MRVWTLDKVKIDQQSISAVVDVFNGDRDDDDDGNVDGDDVVVVTNDDDDDGDVMDDNDDDDVGLHLHEGHCSGKLETEKTFLPQCSKQRM